MSVQRESQLLFPDADVILEPGDVVSVLAHRESEDVLRLGLRGPEAHSPESSGESGADLI